MELKPCPFCGGEVVIAKTDHKRGDEAWFVTRYRNNDKSCHCRVFMESELFDKENEDAALIAKMALVEAWNRRAE